MSNTRAGTAPTARRRQRQWCVGCVWRALLAASLVGLEEGGALVERSNACEDNVTTDVLFAAGAFHTCGAMGPVPNESSPSSGYRRRLMCWGWEDFGQLRPPEMDHVTSVAAGARHSCATDGQRLAACWGSNTHQQCNLPRPFPVVVEKVVVLPYSPDQFTPLVRKAFQSGIAVATAVSPSQVVISAIEPVNAIPPPPPTAIEAPVPTTTPAPLVNLSTNQNQTTPVPARRLLQFNSSSSTASTLPSLSPAQKGGGGGGGGGQEETAEAVVEKEEVVEEEERLGLVYSEGPSEYNSVRVTFGVQIPVNAGIERDSAMIRSALEDASKISEQLKNQSVADISSVVEPAKVLGQTHPHSCRFGDYLSRKRSCEIKVVFLHCPSLV